MVTKNEVIFALQCCTDTDIEICEICPAKGFVNCISTLAGEALKHLNWEKQREGN